MRCKRPKRVSDKSPEIVRGEPFDRLRVSGAFLDTCSGVLDDVAEEVDEALRVGSVEARAFEGAGVLL